MSQKWVYVWGAGDVVYNFSLDTLLPLTRCLCWTSQSLRRLVEECFKKTWRVVNLISMYTYHMCVAHTLNIDTANHVWIWIVQLGLFQFNYSAITFSSVSWTNSSFLKAVCLFLLSSGIHKYLPMSIMLIWGWLTLKKHIGKFFKMLENFGNFGFCLENFEL